ARTTPHRVRIDANGSVKFALIYHMSIEHVSRIPEIASFRGMRENRPGGGSAPDSLNHRLIAINTIGRRGSSRDDKGQHAILCACQVVAETAPPRLLFCR